MEAQENVMTKDSTSCSYPISYPTQNETNINLNNKNYTNDDDNNILNDLILKQTKEIENFGKRISLNLENFRKEILIQQNEIINEPFDIEKVFKKYKEKIDSQLKLIDSLKNRVGELEIDSLIKTQNIKKLQNDFSDFKEDIESTTSAVIPASTSATLDKTNKSIDEDSSTSNQQYSEDNYDEESSTSYQKYSEDNYDEESSASYQKYGEDNYDEESSASYQKYGEDNYDKDSSTSYQKYSEDNCDEESSTSYQKYSEDNYDEESTTACQIYDESSTSYQNYENASYQQYIESDPGITYFDFIQFEHDYNNLAIEQQKSFTSLSKQQRPFTPLINLSNSNVPVHEDILMMIHAKVQEIINEKKNGKRRLDRKFNNHTFHPLCDFDMNNLLKYEKSYLFKSLSKRARQRIKASILVELKDEFSNKKKKLTQPINVYVEKNIIPRLPPGINSYTDYQKYYRYNNSSDKTKRRIQKIISLEQNE